MLPVNVETQPMTYCYGEGDKQNTPQNIPQTSMFLLTPQNKWLLGDTLSSLRIPNNKPLKF